MGDDALAVAAHRADDRQGADRRGGREILDRHAAEAGQRHRGDEPAGQSEQADIGQDHHDLQRDAPGQARGGGAEQSEEAAEIAHATVSASPITAA